MNPETARKLIDLNHQFYQSFASDFSETRGRLQAGVVKVLESVDNARSVLDLGCGNGKVPLKLADLGFQGDYLGADFSLNLLDWAVRDLPAEIQADFIELDLTKPDWSGILPADQYDTIFCFATLHHIPGIELRKSICKNIRDLMTENGKFYLSVWQFLRSERLKSRILPWDTAGLSKNDVDEGDYLLDWRRGGFGVRYAHFYTQEELNLLAKHSGFKIVESFDSDGEGGNLGLYQVWEPV